MGLYGPTEPKSAELWARILERQSSEDKDKKEARLDHEETRRWLDGTLEDSRYAFRNPKQDEYNRG